MFTFATSLPFQYICAALHFGSAISLILFAADSSILSTSGKIPLFIQSSDDEMNSTPTMVELVNPSIFLFLALFSLITGCFHTYYSMSINTHDSTLRFLEYFFTASIMMVVLAILVNIRDIYTLVGMSSLIATTMVFGYLEEKTLDKDLLFRPHLLGYVPYLAAWLILTWQFARVASRAPTFVTVIYTLEFILFTSFGIVQWYYVVRLGSISNKLEMEGAYNLLSITAKMLLVWVCVGGIVGQQN